jgi:membrane-bound lytic murein transglycosylase B
VWLKKKTLLTISRSSSIAMRRIRVEAPYSLRLDDRLAMAGVKRAQRSARWLGRLALGGALLALLVLSRSLPAQGPPAESQKLKPEARKFIGYMARTHGFEADALRALFANARPRQDVLRMISAPTTSRPWYQFKALCVDDAQIADGVRFWNENAALLERARRDFGVPEAIVVALIGIESRYGQYAGGFRVIDSLYTLSFLGTKRADYFRGELEQFLLLAREQGWDPALVQGSFAGALGWPQFMPSNYRRFAIDYGGDGKIDLWSDMADIVGSVASYLREFGWKEGEPVAAPARVDALDPKPLLDLGLKPQLSVAQWQERGVQSAPDITGSQPASLFSLDLINGPEYWFGFDNFYALLRYNYSRNYAMAVYQLGQEISQARERLAVTGFE